MFQECIKWKVGKENRVRLWEDQWLESGTLGGQYSQIFAIAQKKDAKIYDFIMDVEGDERVWQVFVSRNLNSWEIWRDKRLLSTLSLVNPNESNDNP